MKTVLLITFAVVTLLTGCVSVETAAYRTIGSTIVLVDAAMNTWGDYVRTGAAKPDEQANVKTCYEKYQVAMRALRTTVLNYKITPGGASQLDLALRAVESSAGELIGLVRELTQRKATP